MVTAVLMSMSSLGSSAYEPSPYPENPDRPGLPLGNYIQPRATGINEAAAAKQWLRLPALQNIAIAPPSQPLPNDPLCRRGEHAGGQQYSGEIYTVSPPGAPADFGFIGPFTVRTAAFGSVPVEADVVVSQLRDDRGLPIPLRYSQTFVTYCEHTSPFPPLGGREPRPRAWLPAEVTGPVQIQVTALRVDGVDLQLTGVCAADRPSDLALTSNPGHYWDPDLVPGVDFAQAEGDVEALMSTSTFVATFGGLLLGSVDIPPFTGCDTAGADDVSRLLTAAVSGPDNRVEMRAEAFAQGAGGQNSCAWDLSCTPLPAMQLPAKEAE